MLRLDSAKGCMDVIIRLFPVTSTPGVAWLIGFSCVVDFRLEQVITSSGLCCSEVVVRAACTLTTTSMLLCCWLFAWWCPIALSVINKRDVKGCFGVVVETSVGLPQQLPLCLQGDRGYGLFVWLSEEDCASELGDSFACWCFCVDYSCFYFLVVCDLQ